MGWYHPWPVEPKDAIWEVVTDKPLIISEFGGEALYGQSGDENVVSSWSEEYQARFVQRQYPYVRQYPEPAWRISLDSVRLPFPIPFPPHQSGWLEPQRDSYPTRVCVRKRGI